MIARPARVRPSNKVGTFLLCGAGSNNGDCCGQSCDDFSVFRFLQGHDPRTIPHTHLCKWIRSPHDPARTREGVLRILARSHVIGGRSTHDPFTIPHNGILQGYDPRAIPHSNLCKWERSPHASEKGCLGSPHDPMRSRGEAFTTPSRSRTTASYNGMIPARFHTPTSANGYDPHTIPHDPEKGCARSPHDPAPRHHDP